jgi:hypothetical protein
MTGEHNPISNTAPPHRRDLVTGDAVNPLIYQTPIDPDAGGL